MRTRAAAAVIAVALLGAVGFAAPALAAGDDLNCGDPGTSHNMPVGPDDPDGLDADEDGIGCEDASVFGEPAPTTPTDPAPTDPAPSDPVVEPSAAPATPVVRTPTFTG